MRRFNDMLQDVVQDENDLILTILDKRMTVIAGSNVDITPLGTQLEFQPRGTFQNIMANTSEYSPVFANERLYVYRPLLEANWVIVMSQPLVDAYASWRNMIDAEVVPILLSAILLMGLAYQIGVKSSHIIEILRFRLKNFRWYPN